MKESRRVGAAHSVLYVEEIWPLPPYDEKLTCSNLARFQPPWEKNPEQCLRKRSVCLFTKDICKVSSFNMIRVGLQVSDVDLSHVVADSQVNNIRVACRSCPILQH